MLPVLPEARVSDPRGPRVEAEEMALFKSARERWFSVTLYALFSAFFLVAGVVSTSTYVNVVGAQYEVALEDASFSAEDLGDGALEVRFSIDLVNPSRYALAIQSLVWEAIVINGTSGPGWYIPVADDYIGPTAYVEVAPMDTMTFEFAVVVDDPLTLSRLQGFIDYSAGQGQEYTLETLPITHEFYVVAWVGDFKHDYLREMYLNEMVRIELEYSSEVGL